jgi:hypothetical protein
VTTGGARALFGHRGDRVELRVVPGAIERFRGDAASGLGWHAPVYGRIEAATSLRVVHAATAPFWLVSVFGLHADNALRSVDLVPVWAEAGALRSAVGIRIVREASTDHLLIAERDPASRAATWRLGEFETDAHLAFVRTDANRAVARVALVDGSLIRSASRRALELSAPEPVSDLHLDVRHGARLAGRGLGARVVVNGSELTIAPERRVAGRARAARVDD